MKILAIEKDAPGGSYERCQPYLKAEAIRTWELYQEGVLREAYFRADRSEAILMLECTNVEEARNIIQTLPLVKEKLIDFDIIPLIAYPGFARLFGR